MQSNEIVLDDTFSDGSKMIHSVLYIIVNSDIIYTGGM